MIAHTRPTNEYIKKIDLGVWKCEEKHKEEQIGCGSNVLETWLFRKPSLLKSASLHLVELASQVHLPPGFSYNKHKSHAVSFAGPIPLPKGTRRTREQALMNVRAWSAWSWQWWQTLSEDAKGVLSSGPAEKKQRVA